MVAIFILSLLFASLPIVIGIWVYNSLSDKPAVPTYSQDDVQLNVQQDWTPRSVRNTSDKLGAEPRRVFIEGCVEEGGRFSACACMYDYVDRSVTNDEFWALVDLPDSQLLSNPIIEQSITNCVGA